MKALPVAGACVAVYLVSACKFSHGTALQTQPRPDSSPGDGDAPAPDSPRPVDAAPDVAISLLCPSTYTYSAISGTAYRVTTGGGDMFAGAASVCTGDQPAGSSVFTHLVVISSTAELAELVATYSADDKWVGLTDLVSSPNYQWVTAEPTPAAPWSVGEPNNTNTESCVHVDPNTHLLDTIGCGQTHNLICECDTYANDPSRY